MVIFSVDLDNIILDNVNFDEDDPETIIHARLLSWRNRFKQRKVFRKKLSKELMPLAWHSRTWWDCCILEEEKKEIK